MNKKSKFYPGKHLFSQHNVIKKQLTFEQINSKMQQNSFVKPEFQGALEANRITEMIFRYKIHPEFFHYKNTVVIGHVNNELYIIDGQHRIEMACLLSSKYPKEIIIIAYYKLNSMGEARDLFNEINIDSHKNKIYIDLCSFQQIKRDEFSKKIKNNYGQLFSKQKGTSKNKCMEEFISELVEIHFLENKTAQDAFIELHKLNVNFFNSIYPPIIKNEAYNTLLYKNEIKSIVQSNVVFITKQNNFIDYIKNNTVKPRHIWKGGKKRITHQIKKKIWHQNYGKSDIVNCPIPWCLNKITHDSRLPDAIKQGASQFQAGHVISEYNGGEVSLTNLRPICKECNLSMGSKNWEHYLLIN
jgi:hypothetical protein